MDRYLFGYMVVILKSYYNRINLTKKVVFTGCSFTAGNGWKNVDLNNSGNIECKDAPELWVNLCHSNIPKLQNLELENFSKMGSSNPEIFKQTVDAVAKFDNQIGYLFCQWTGMPRYNLNVGFELWNTSFNLHKRSSGNLYDINLNRGEKYSKKYLKDLLNRFLALHNIHEEIVKVVQYTTILSKLCNNLGIKIYFINGLCPWDQDYFVRLSGPETLPEDYTVFTKETILNITNRSDEDIFKLYNIMHNDYEQAGGIDSTQWVNLYNSMACNKIDTNYDTLHPGTKSNQLYFQQIKSFLETQ